MKNTSRKQGEKSFEELKKISDDTKAMIKRDRPSHISATTLMNMMGIEVIDHTIKDDDYEEKYIG